MAQIEVTRKELYELVWSTPMNVITQKYKLSNNDLKKICSDLRIPLPGLSYWSNINIGKSVSIPVLSDKFSGNESVNLFLRESEIQESPLETLQKEIEKDATLILEVPNKLLNPDKLIDQAKKTLLADQSYKYNKGHARSAMDELNISVAPENIERSILFMDTLIKLLRKRGHELIIKENDTYAIVNNEKVKVCLREKNQRISENDWPDRYQPTGKLILTCEFYYIGIIEFKDGNTLIEKQLSKILAKLEIKSYEEKEKLSRLEKIWAENHEMARIAKENEERQAKELSDFKSLLLESERWHKANILRNYIDSLENKHMTLQGISDDLNERILWARKKLDWFDPMINEKDELLKNINPNTLIFKECK